MFNKIEMASPLYVMNTFETAIYKVASFRQLDSEDFGLVYDLELVAGWEYGGFIDAEEFPIEEQLQSITVSPLSETLADRLKDEEFRILDSIENMVFAKPE